MTDATLLVQVPAPPGGGPPFVANLGPGAVATFGRGSPDEPVDIPISHPAVSRLAGEIRGADDYWLISNLSRHATYVVDNPEGAGEYLRIPPRRVGAPVPFEFARVVLPVDEGEATFLVFAPQHVYADEGSVGGGGEVTTAAFALDETAKYFLILVALCEPRLRDSSTVALPSVPEIVDRLAPLDAGRGLTASAVNYHIDYLATTKLRVKQRAGIDEWQRLEWKREALVATAVRFGLVDERHLRLLPSRRPAAGRGPG